MKILFIVILMFFTVLINSQTDSIKINEIVNPNLTVVDYGATLFKTKEAALKYKVGSSSAIKKMIDDVGTAVLPCYGWLYIDKEIYLYKKWESVIGNGNCNLVTDLPLNIFHPLYHSQTIKGFVAHLENSGSVIYAGGKHNAPIAKNANKDWYNRTQILGNLWDFDFEGNYTSTPIKLEFSKSELEKWGTQYSHIHFTKIRGFWYGVDRGIYIDKMENTGQSINTLDVDVNIWGAKKFADIQNINFSSISILGQNKGEVENETFNVKGSNLNGNIFIYDLRGQKGVYDVKGLDLSGYYDYLPYPVTTHVKLGNSTIKNVEK